MSTPDTHTAATGRAPHPDPTATAGMLRVLLERNGTWALCKVFAALAVFLVLHLVRAALVLLVRFLAGCMNLADGYATRHLTRAPSGPVNHYFDPHTDHPVPRPRGAGPPDRYPHWEVAHA